MASETKRLAILTSFHTLLKIAGYEEFSMKRTGLKRCFHYSFRLLLLVSAIGLILLYWFILPIGMISSNESRVVLAIESIQKGLVLGEIEDSQFTATLSYLGKEDYISWPTTSGFSYGYEIAIIETEPPNPQIRIIAAPILENSTGSLYFVADTYKFIGRGKTLKEAEEDLESFLEMPH